MKKIAIFIIFSFGLGLLFSANSHTLIKEGKSAITPSFGTYYDIRGDKHFNTVGLNFIYSKGIRLYVWHNLESGNNGLYAYYIKVLGYGFVHLGADYYKNSYYNKYVDALWWGGGFQFPLDEHINSTLQTYRITITEDNYKYWVTQLGLSYNFKNNLNLSLYTEIKSSRDDSSYPGFGLHISYNFILNNSND